MKQSTRHSAKMVLKAVTLVILSVAFSLQASATAQYPDKVWYNGKEYAMHTNPLEVFFEKNPGRKPKDGVQSTALWRGYVATFEIKDNQLLLKDIEIQIVDTAREHSYKWMSVLNEVFPDQRVINIDWFTGLLVLPCGKRINYVHMGYGSTYENYILLEIGQGKLTREKKLGHKEYEKFKAQQFQAFKETDEYKKLKESLKKDGSTNAFIDSFLKDFITEYSTKILVDN
ncbi:hypothetical protein D3H65_18950 [Paraflavitalea soli]|uniref:DUF4468 domain-containing protein n=1 Tax=Paraflavitalea soli TaxID=2315862 RepID=A0A3B7MN87_9BACT|nr:hypothetical protein [Paraflavitalea soli]AXY75932.1 hypothetical protein D3H65_18950 [Paraflavitalea soli]